MGGASGEHAPPVMLYFLRACRASRRLVRAGHDTDADFQIWPSRQASPIAFSVGRPISSPTDSIALARSSQAISIASSSLVGSARAKPSRMAKASCNGFRVFLIELLYQSPLMQTHGGDSRIAPSRTD
jgi:hypothetical protein